ncbi:MAG: hypothetical protein SGARI_001465 [Bacillariaceae sp.]
MATVVDVTGNQLKLDGSFNPRWGENNFPRLLQVLSNPQVVSIRLSQIDFRRLDQAFVTLLGTVLKSRVWDRIYFAYCAGTLPDSCLQGLMMTKQLEIYGSMLDILPTLGGALASNTTPIEYVRLRTRFQEDTVIPLADGIKSTKTLKKLYLTCAFADQQSAHLLATSLSENKSLVLLSLYGCEFENEDSVGQLLRALQDHPRLSTLELRDNNLCDAAALSALVRHTTTIENLDLYLPPQAMHQMEAPRLDSESFSFALRENTSLKSLALANNALSATDTVFLSMALRSNATLERLNLQGNLINDEAIQALATSLPEMSLKELW